MQRYKLLIKQQIKYGINCVKLKKIFLKFFSFAKFEYLHQTLRASCYLPPHLYVFLYFAHLCAPFFVSPIYRYFPNEKYLFYLFV